MTAQTIRPTVATRPTAPTAAPVAHTPEAARWAAYIEAHRPATRRRARADLRRGALGLLAVAAFVTGAALLVAALPALVAQMLAGAVAFMLAGAIPLLAVLATRRPWVEPTDDADGWRELDQAVAHVAAQAQAAAEGDTTH